MPKLINKKFSNTIIELVGPATINFKEFVNIFKGKRRIKIENIELEYVYRDALHNPNSNYSIDDLNIMTGDFTGNHNKLKKLSSLKFKKFRDVLQSSSLS